MSAEHQHNKSCVEMHSADRINAFTNHHHETMKMLSFE